jgi:hypothetical protein
MQLVQPLWKKIGGLLKNLNIDMPYDPAIPLLGIYPKECDTGTPKAPAAFGTTKDALLLMNGLRKCGIYTQWNFTQP